MPALVAGLAEERRLLVAGDAGDHQRLAEHRPRAACRRLARTSAPRAASRAARRSSCSSSSSQSPVWMLKSIVREALDDVGDVRAAAGELPDEPGVDRAEGELAALGALARAGDVVEQPADLGAAEVGIDHQPGALAHQAFGAHLSSARAHCGAVRRSCQTMALWIGSPVCRSQRIVVSRWLVMPMPITSFSATSLWRAPRARVSRCVAQISFGSCSTQPGCGKIWRNSRCAVATGAAVLVEQDRARAGGSLVESEDVAHRAILLPLESAPYAIAGHRRRARAAAHAPRALRGLQARRRTLGHRSAPHRRQEPRQPDEGRRAPRRAADPRDVAAPHHRPPLHRARRRRELRRRALSRRLRDHRAGLPAADRAQSDQKFQKRH